MFGLMFKSTHLDVVRDMAADLREETRRANENGIYASSARKQRDAADNALFQAEIALFEIAAMATPNCAHIGKKMAARAEKALGRVE